MLAYHFVLNYALLFVSLWSNFASAAYYETVEEAAILARSLVDFNALGTMATVYPDNHPTLPGEPFSLQEYYASCHANGSLTLLIMPISRHGQNILSHPNHAASVSVSRSHPAANRARVALIGNVTVFRDIREAPDVDEIQACYLEQHPDARHWIPGPKEPHVAYWARFDLHTIYYVGGFGSEHYIGYIPLELYENAAEAPGDNSQLVLRT
ncbi:hypothetical protein CERSUDRAFT_114541 [Gelatoporia subvermispora B]|uniref:CREG-like beta-barrel domain-containing protein n=1 Tax=Ceriporiopsis subvermispora (strain B) TaxID=914234 RepID=M2RHD9_CERS8|nr:hypothetical protein CERSUDRAFT_114541 [Gelatoporia subvermispora B]